MIRQTARKNVRHGLLVLVVVACAGPAGAGGLGVVTTIVDDNGDHDGYADTRETVSLSLVVQNTSGVDLKGLSLTAQTDDSALVCVTGPLVYVGDLAAGETRLTDPFVLAMSGADRTSFGLSPFDDLSLRLDLASPSHPELRIDASRIVLDVDLDVAGGSGATTFFESFEETLGGFEIENLDQGLHGPVAGEGSRCQTHDPDWPNSNTYNSGFAADCYPGVTAAQADAVFWGLSGPNFSPLGGRGFTGFHSLFFGIDLGPPENWTTPFGALEAVRTTEPVALAPGAATPTLSFKHQISIFNDYGGVPNTAIDRAVVMAQLADDTGQPAGPWIKLYPYLNPYDSPVVAFVVNCMFDPVDDGNTEDDFFEPFDPSRFLGPSSTCEPEVVFAEMGETSEPFDPSHLGLADGPGMQGNWGIGTWIESRVDLSRFRGRSVRLRFLSTSVKADSVLLDWEQLNHNNPDPEDDGWWIDDVTVTDVLTLPAAVALDDADNLSLPTPPDGDVDGVYDACDNCPSGNNPSQADLDDDGQGDACDTCTDTDGDGCGDPGFPANVCCADNCPEVFNPGQLDNEGDGIGDICDPDDDNDGLLDVEDNCVFTSNPAQTDGDDDGAGLACDCDDTDAATHPGAAEVNDGKDNQCSGDQGHGLVDEISGAFRFYTPSVYAWPAQSGATQYQVARAGEADFSSGCEVLASSASAFGVDAEPPAPGSVFHYLVRATAPNAGSWGATSAGPERVVPCQ